MPSITADSPHVASRLPNHRPGSQKRPRGTPRHRSSSDEESGSDGEEEDENADAWASKRTKTLQADEALALKLLGV